MGNKGSTPLHKAAEEKDLAALRWEVQQHPALMDTQEQTMGWTALHVAAAKGSDPIARELLARGAKPDVLDKDGRTALHLACMCGYPEVVKALLRRGAATSLRDKDGKAPYDYAVQRHPNVAALLGGPPPPTAVQPPPPPPPYGTIPAVDVTSSASANQLLPAPPPSAPPASTGVGGNAFPRVQYDRLPTDALLPTPPTMPAAPPPAGPAAARPGYDAARYDAQPHWQEQQRQPPNAAAGVLPYPAVPGLQLPQAGAPPPSQQHRAPSGGAVWPVAGGIPVSSGSASAANPYGQPPAPPQPPSQPSQLAATAGGPGIGGRSGSGGVSGGGTPKGSADLDWAPSVQSDWGGEPDVPSVQPPQPRGFNPVASARYQLERLLGAGLAQMGLGGGGGPSTDPRVASVSAASGASTASSSRFSAANVGSGGRVYSYEQLWQATGGFSAVNKLGEGGYGPVYRGSLDGIPVAVKVMDTSEGCMQGREEFEAEVAILSSLHHPHVVLLIGSCPDKGILVYELMTNSSLEAHLFGRGGAAAGGGGGPAWPGGSPGLPLGWRDRVRMAAEVAAALLFLHTAPTPIVHMDLKPANILLDEHLTAKLGDVGLARLAPTLDRPAGPAGVAAAHVAGRQQAPDTRLVGTWDYMDPEYLRTGQFSGRSDVYALGVVMLQLLTGREGAKDLIALVSEARRQPLRFSDCIDPRVGPGGPWPAVEAAAFADLALSCVQTRPGDRPDLRTVILPTLSQLRQRTTLYGTPPPQQVQQQPEEAVPQVFICPITQDVMEDPVVAADGYTYERLAIAEWMARARTSPLTNMPLPDTVLRENRTLRSAIREWREEQQKKQGRAARGPAAPPGAASPAAPAPPPRRVVADDSGW